MMFDKFKESFYKFDDEIFLSNLSTPEGLEQKVAVFRRYRLANALMILLFLGVIGFILYSFSDFFFTGIGVFFIVTVFLINFFVADIKIKMLLLYKKSLTQ